MHELFNFFIDKSIKIVDFQTTVAILAFHGYFSCQSIIGSALSLAFYLWVFTLYIYYEIIISACFFLLLGIIVVYRFKVVKHSNNIHKIYFYLIQPFLLHYIVPRFIPHTLFPIGYILGLIFWLPPNFLIHNFSASLSQNSRISLYSLIISLFLFGFIFYKYRWVSISISFLIQLFILLALK